MAHRARGFSLLEMLLVVAAVATLAILSAQQAPPVAQGRAADMGAVHLWLERVRVTAPVRGLCLRVCHASLGSICAGTGDSQQLYAQHCYSETTELLGPRLPDPNMRWHWRGRGDMPGYTAQGRAYNGSGTLTACRQGQALARFIFNRSGRIRRATDSSAYNSQCAA